MSARKNVKYYIKKNIFIVLVLIGLCPVLALSYAKFTINSESYRSNEMYISELLYSIKIDNKNTYTIDIDPGETEHTIEITSLNAVSTNYKLAYLNNDNLGVKYATDYLEPSFGGIVTTRKISLTIKNTSTKNQTLSLMVFGGYSFNDISEVKVLDTYTEILDDYWRYDYETTALYIDNTRVDKLNSTKKYDLVGYTCSNDASVIYDSDNRNIIIHSDYQTKCSLYFEESKYFPLYIINNYQKLGLTKIEQTATGNQNYDTTEYRYQGNNPSNYITFNGEKNAWRIIGVFEVETPNGDGTYKREYKVKIVRDIAENVSWNYKSASEYKNDWTTSTLMTMLNSGPYYNRISGYTQLACSTGYDTTINSSAICNYESNGLTTEAKNQISSTKLYLGNIVYTSGGGYGNTKEIYIQERSTNVHSGNSQTWDGKVALIYPSDYMYASSSCYNDDTKKGYDEGGTSPYDTDYRSENCRTTNWLFDQNNRYWSLSPYSIDINCVMFVTTGGHVGIAGLTYTAGLRPTVYLSSNVNYISGDGTIFNPFTIK